MSTVKTLVLPNTYDVLMLMLMKLSRASLDPVQSGCIAFNYFMRLFSNKTNGYILEQSTTFMVKYPKGRTSKFSLM